MDVAIPRNRKMCMMNISVDNLGNYISNQQLKEFSHIYDMKQHPLDEDGYFELHG